MDDTLPRRVPGEAMMAIGDPDAASEIATAIEEIAAMAERAIPTLVALVNAMYAFNVRIRP